MYSKSSFFLFNGKYAYHELVKTYIGDSIQLIKYTTLLVSIT